MSYKDKNDINFKDYLDVSSEEDPIKNNKKEESNTINKNKLIDNEYYSYKNKDMYLEDKYYYKKKRKRSSESSSSKHRKKYNKSRSRSHHHRNKKYHYHYKKNESDYSNKKNNNRSSSNSISSYYYKRDKYRNRDRNKRYRDDDNIYEKKYNKRYSKSNSNNNKKDEKSYENKNKSELIKGNKWTDGDKKEEFKQIKIEKYDKNKSLKEIQKKKEKDEEISKLKKDLNNKEENKLEIEKEKPNFEPSGILLRDLEMDYNKSINSKIIINYNPPKDSVIPNKNEIWFLFKFSEDKKEEEETYKLIDKEFFLIGKDPRICDIRIKQKNISRQHAVIQFRKIRKEKKWEILPYLIDLNSTNGTYLNGDKIDNKKYYELRDKDQLNFGDKNIDFLLMKTK